MQPLKGIKVLELSNIGPCPFCTMFLSDFGAEVLNIEVPLTEGRHLDGKKQIDSVRKRDKIYNSLYRNKKSIAINLKVKEGQKIFYELAKKADIIVEGFRPGAVKRLGIDYHTISAKNPRIIYCSITGYGQKGPYSTLPGHDINYLSMSGALSLITDKKGNHIIPLNLLGDFAGGGLYAAIGILIALYVREKLGIGQYIDISMTNAIMSLLTIFFDYYLLNGILPEGGRSGASGYYPYYCVYQTKDGKYLSIGCTEPWFWERLCEIVGRKDFVPFHYAPEHMYKFQNKTKWLQIRNRLKAFFRSKTRDELFDLLADKDIPVAKVYSLSEVSSDSHIKQQKMIIEIENPVGERIRQIGIPIKLSKTKGKARSLGPQFAENTKEVLKKLGYDKNKIEEFIRTGVIQHYKPKW